MRDEAHIRNAAEKLKTAIDAILPHNPKEAELRAVIERQLEAFLHAEAHLLPPPRLEVTLASGRADAVFNRFVIEYKRPDVLSDRSNHSATQQAIKQLRDYLSDLAQKERHEVHRVAGVVFDGRFIIFARFVDGAFTAEAPKPVSIENLERMLTWLTALASGVALTADNLARDFGIEQYRTQQTLKALYTGLQQATQDTDSLVSKLFEQWRILFSEAIDYSEAFGGGKLEQLQKWARKAGFDIRSAYEAEQFFFVLHTYFALLAKLIARLAVMRALLDKVGVHSYEQLAALPSDALQEELQKIESGDLFRQIGIQNLLEGDFFSWYLRAWNADIERGIRLLLQQLSHYDPTTLTLVPEETRDLFKKLYHYLLPREVRHNLGEYYTPDWLAERLLRQMDNTLFADSSQPNERTLRQKVLQTRFLDPACGSGTFLVLILRRLMQLQRNLQPALSEGELLEAITRNVVGFDINPLAVLTARVNYLLAIADLLPYRKGDLSVPVYLADSVLMPAFSTDMFKGSVYLFRTAVGEFQIPTALCTPTHFNRLCDMMEECVLSEVPAEAFLQRVSKMLSQSPTGIDYEPLRETYQRMLELHQRGLNGLWARILKNNFAPLTVGQFDYIVGNPPWINWEHLPDNYRDSIRKLWEQYKLPPQSGGARLGAVKGDFSALMTLVVADKLLKPNGKLGFVITQSLFKTAAGAGFRRFILPGGTPLKVLLVEDMVDLNPFEGASNRTAVLVLLKGQPTRYPVSYTLWRKKRDARFTYTSTLGEVKDATTRHPWFAEPAQPNAPTSQWLTVPQNALKAIRKVMGNADYEAHLGVNSGGANSVYWLEKQMERPDGLWLMRNLTEGAKRKVKEVVNPLEPELLYPLLRGRDVQRWHARPSAWILVPQDPSQPNRAYPEDRLQVDYPKAYAYLKQFEKELRQRSGYKQILSKREREFYGMMDINTYTFAPWKVVWPNIASELNAAVVSESDGKVIVPQHIVTLVDCQSAEEAHYVCALINSQCANFTARAYSQEGGKSFGDPHILEHIRIPRYDPQNALHRRLAELSQEAHRCTQAIHAYSEDDADEVKLTPQLEQEIEQFLLQQSQTETLPEDLQQWVSQRQARRQLREVEAEIDQCAAQLWGLTPDELKAVKQALQILSGDSEANDDQSDD